MEELKKKQAFLQELDLVCVFSRSSTAMFSFFYVRVKTVHWLF